MGYRDDFYAAGNIIGYTGELDSNPSVYFRRDVTKGGYVEWGRITQAHDEASNVGRALVRGNRRYEVRNVTRQGETSAVEFVDGAAHHESRNEFHPVTSGTRAALAQAITGHPELRSRHKRYITRDALALGAELTAGGSWEI